MALESTWEPVFEEDLTEKDRQIQEALLRYYETFDATELTELGFFAPDPQDEKRKEDG